MDFRGWGSAGLRVSLPLEMKRNGRGSPGEADRRGGGHSGIADGWWFAGVWLAGAICRGCWGEWIGMMVGVMTTPFFLEASFIFIGLTLVMAINHWRQKREGDECVYLEQVDAGRTRSAGAGEMGGLSGTSRCRGDAVIA